MRIINSIKKNKYYIFLFLLTILFFNQFFISNGKMLLPGDTLGSAYFPKYFFSNFVKQFHQLPLWNPYWFSGMPFLADPSSSMFYPLNLIYLILPLGYAFSYLYILDIFLIGLFTYSYAKTIKLDNFSAFISSITFMFSGTILFRIYAGHLYILDAIVWLPLLLSICELIIRSNKSIYGIIGAIPVALMVFAGHSQYTYYNLLFTSGYFFLRLLIFYLKNKSFYLIIKPSLIYMLSLIFGLGLSAIQLLPSLELSSLSERGGGISFEFATAFYLHPFQIISFIFPFFFGSPFNNTFWGKGNFWETCGYIGILPLILIFTALFIAKNKYVLIFAIISFVSIIISFGDHSPIYGLLFNHFPFFNLFRNPARFLYFYAFSGAIISAFGINSILNLKLKKNNLIKIKKLLLIFIIILVILFSLILSIQPSKYLHFFEKYILKNSLAVNINHLQIFKQILEDFLRFTVIIILTLSSFFLFISKKITDSIFKIIISFIIIADLFVMNTGIVDLTKTNDQYHIPKIINKILEDKSIYRIFSQTGEFSNIALINGVQITTGYNGEYLKKYRDFIWQTGKHENTPYESFIIINSIDNPTILNLLNVKYIIWNKKLNNNNFKYIGEYNESNIKSYLYQNLSLFPRAYVTSKLNPINKSEIYKIAKIKKYSANEIIVDVNIEKPGYLVLSEIWYPGWVAYDNKINKEILKSNSIFKSVYLKKGDHEIKFIFKPKSYELYEAISFITVIIIVFFFIFYKYKPKLHHLL